MMLAQINMSGVQNIPIILDKTVILSFYPRSFQSIHNTKAKSWNFNLSVSDPRTAQYERKMQNTTSHLHF